MIIDLCPFSTLKNLRMVCKLLDPYVTPRLFQEFHMGLFTSSLEDFVALSKHPILSRCVHSVIFPAGALMPDCTLSEFEAQIDLRPYHNHWTLPYYHYAEPPPALRKTVEIMGVLPIPDRGAMPAEVDRFEKRLDKLPRHFLTAEALNYHFEIYHELRQEQMDWGEVEDQMFADAICSLPNLTAASSENLNAYGPLLFDEPILPWVQLETLVTGRAESPRVSKDPEWMYSTIHMKPANCLLRAIIHRARNNTKGHKHLRQLILDNASGQPFLNPIDPAMTEPPPAPMMLDFSLFKHFRDLRLKINVGPFGEAVLPDRYAYNQNCRSQQTISQAREMLSNASSVECLTLGLEDSMAYSTRSGVLIQLGPLFFPSLRQLTFFGDSIRHDELSQFLNRHSDTLRHLSLEGLVLLSGRWEHIFGSLRNISRLEKFFFCDLEDMDGTVLFKIEAAEEYEKTVEDWVLKRPCPPWAKLVDTLEDCAEEEIIYNLLH